MEDVNSLVLDVLSSGTIPKRTLLECFGSEPTNIESEWVENKAIGISGWYNYRCTFALAMDIEKFLYVVDHFCKMFEGNAHIGAEMLLNDIADTIECEHKYMRVNHFALGTWTGLCGFIEKFSSSVARDHSISISRIQASFYHHRRYLEIYFKNKINGHKLCDVYKLKVAYENITKIVVKRELRHRDAFFECERKKEPMELFLHVTTVSVYRWNDKELNAYEYFFDGDWDRTGHFGSPGGPTYCGSVGAINVLKLKLDDTEGYPADAIYSLFRAAEAPVLFANVKRYDMPKNAQPLTCDKGSPDVQYALACLHSLSPELSLKIALDQSKKQIQDLLTQLAAEDDATLAAALYDIFYAVRDCPIIDMKLAIEDSFAEAKAGENVRSVVSKEKLPENLFLVKKATVCPSKIVVEPPTVVQVNALLRNFDADNVMLVDIRDDDRKKLRFHNQDEARTFIPSSIAEKIKKGLKIAGKTFFFLGFTKTQIEDFSFWAYAVDKNAPNTINSVRQQLGIEGDIDARVNIQDLVFAEALGCVEVDPEWVTEEDCEVPRTEDFKLGIGRISSAALNSIVDSLKLNHQARSAIRVVHGGRKGILALDPSLEGNKIVYRKSQVIVPSQDRVLYVIETNEVRKASLNKVFLSTLGSKLHDSEDQFSLNDFLTPFYQLLSDSVLPFDEDPLKKAFPVEAVLPHIVASDISSTGYDTRGDGLFRQAMRCKQLKACRRLKMLKEQVESTYELMPVVDELGVLNEGEVFVQLGVERKNATVLSSAVVVARKDAMQPAELRRFDAVDRRDVVEALGHLSNCVVFPSKGSSRPLAWLSREADYGDDSNVILIANSSFIFRNNDTPQLTKVRVGQPVLPDCDLETHYFEFLQYASYNHFEEVFCALCDVVPRHAYSECCTRTSMLWRLLEEHRRGGKQPEPLQNITRFPDFLEKISDRKTYSSARPLGHIFRKIRLVDVDDFENTLMEIKELTFQAELQIDGSEVFDEVAEKDIFIFKRNLAGLASLYRVSVDEILTGTIFSISEDRLSDERIKNIESTMKSHVKHLATICNRQFKRGMKKASTDEILQKVSAYYVASRKFPKDGGYAFPWMFPDLMLLLISHSEPQPPPVPQTKITRRLLTDVGSGEDLEMELMTNIFGIIENWIKANKRICAISRHDNEYFSNKLTEYETEAFRNAFRTLESHDDRGQLHERLKSDPLPLLAETFRQMLFVSSKSADQKFSRNQFFMMAIQALLSNTLVRIAATSSFGILLKPKKILREKIVNRRMLFPLDCCDTKYIRVTQNNLQEFEKKLCEYSGCQQVNVRLLPKLENAECDYEEVTAKGSWFAVVNLEIIMLTANFRSVALNMFNVELRRGYCFDDD